MTKEEQYKILFENWRKYTSDNLQEVSIYKYSGTAKDPTGAWDPKSVTKVINPDLPGLDKEVDITPEKWLELTKDVAIVGSATVAGKNIDEIVKFGLKLALGALVGAGVVVTAAARAGLRKLLRKPGLQKKGFLRLFGRLAARLAWPVAVGTALWSAYQYVQGKKSAEDAQRDVAAIEPAVDLYIKTTICKWCNDNPGKRYPEVKPSDNAQLKAFKLAMKDNPNRHCSKLCKEKRLTKGSVSPLTGEFTTIHGVIHNLAGDAKKNAEAFVEQLFKMGITNKYILAGAIATQGKETGFRNMAERGKYSLKHLMNPKTTMHKKVTRLFKRSRLGEPEQRHWEKLSFDKNPGNGPIALLNLVYGYSDANVKRRNYQGDEEITIPILIDGDLNPALYGESGKKLAGWKYRGRGPLQTTFKSTYAATAARAGLDVQEILDNPDLLLTNSTIAARMSAAYSKNPYDNIVGRRGEPKNLEEGIRVMVQIAGAPNAKSFPSYLNKTLARAMNTAARHIRIDDEQVAQK